MSEPIAESGRAPRQGMPDPRTWGAAVAAGSALGALLIALPDDDRRVVSISQTHGPSLVDLVGSLLLVAAWLPVPVLSWRLRRRVRRPVWAAAGAVAAVGAVALAVTVSRDLGWWWLPSAIVLAVAQLVPLASVVASSRRGAARTHGT